MNATTAAKPAGIEVTLACGDTITVKSVPAIGTYRMCIHCDSRKRVVGLNLPSKPTEPWCAPLTPADARKLYDILMRGYDKMYKLEQYNERRRAWDFDLTSAASEVLIVALDLIRVT